MDLTPILQGLNIITLFNTVFGEGIGELITLLTFMGFFAGICWFTIEWALLKEKKRVGLVAKITQTNTALVCNTDGSVSETSLKRGVNEYIRNKGKEDEKSWIIQDRSWEKWTNGTGFTILHPKICHNISLHELVDFYVGYSGRVRLQSGEVIDETVRNMMMDATSLSRLILQAVNSRVNSRMKDNNAKLYALAGVAMIMFATAACLWVVFSFMSFPECVGGAVAAAQQTVQAATTTATLPTVPPVSGGIR